MLEIELHNVAKEIGADLKNCFESKGVPGTIDFVSIYDHILSLPPELYQYTDGGAQLMQRTHEIVLSVTNDKKLATDFVDCCYAMIDLHKEGIAKLILPIAVPLEPPGLDTDDPPPEVLEIIERTDGNVKFDPWTVLSPGVPVRSSSSLASPSSLEFEAPGWLIGIGLIATALAVMGDPKEKNFFKALEKGFRKVRDKVAKFFSKVFGW